MGIVERVIDVFERRISHLEEIRYLPDLPRWTDADVIGAKCLVEQYRNLTNPSSIRKEACPQCVGEKEAVGMRYCGICGRDLRC